MRRIWASAALFVLLGMGLRGTVSNHPIPNASHHAHSPLMAPWLDSEHHRFLVLDLHALRTTLRATGDALAIWPDDLAYATLAVAPHRADTHAWRVTLYCPTPQRALEIADTLGGIMTLFQMEPRALPLTTWWHSVTVRPQSTAVELEGIWTTSDLAMFTTWLIQEESADAPTKSH